MSSASNLTEAQLNGLCTRRLLAILKAARAEKHSAYNREACDCCGVINQYEGKQKEYEEALARVAAAESYFELVKKVCNSREHVPG